MSNTKSSSELRLFLSSTFRDLQEEREHLVRKIFPEIRALCRERGVVFTEIDLRWGLTEEEGTLGRIIGACLEEVDRCRPWFIGIFGSRYGWVPPFREIYKDPDLLRQHPWLEEGAVDGMSIMEMEVRHALGLHPNRPVPGESETVPPAKSNALLYHRIQRRRPGTPPVEEDARLEALINEITEAGWEPRVFRTPETLGEMIYDDLVALIEQSFKREGTSELQIERFDHEAFAVSRRHAYIPNYDYIRRLDEFADFTRTDDTRQTILVLHALSGLGKSALLAHWVSHYRTHNPGAFIIEHYIGIGSGTGSRAGILRHILMELRERGEIDEEIPENPEQLLPLIPEWFSRLNGEQAILLLDGVNQLPENERDLSWVPGHIPQSVRLIISTTEPLLNEIGEVRPWPEMTLEPLSHEEREAVIVRFLGEYHKGLSRERIQAIASTPQTAEPLYLRTLLEELRVSGFHEHLDSTIAHYLAAEDTPALFQRVLERLEEDFGVRRVREVLSLIWCSRNGLSDSELAELTSFSRMHLNLLLTALDYHLVRRTGLYTFFHDHLASAVERRYLAGDDSRSVNHRRIGEYFANSPITDRRLDEEPWAWQEAGDISRLQDCLVNPETFRAMSAEDRKYELARYWRGVNFEELMGGYDIMLEGVAGESTIEIDLSRALGEALLIIGESQRAERYLTTALQLAESLDDNERRVDALLAMGSCLIALGGYQAAEDVLRRALDLSTASGKKANARVAECLASLSTALYENGKFSEAQKIFEDAIELCEVLQDPKLAFTCASGLGAVFYQKGELESAIEALSRSREIVEEQNWWNTPLGAECLNNFATIFWKQAEYYQAESYIARAIDIRRKGPGETNRTTITMMLNHGKILEALERDTDAEELLRHTIHLERNLNGERHPDLAHRMGQLAIYLRKRNRFDEAEAIYREAIRIQRDMLGEDHPATIQSQLQYAETRHLQGFLEESISIYETILPRKKDVYGADHPKYIYSYSKYLELVNEHRIRSA